MKKCPSVSVFWRQWHRGDRKFKTMALKGCSNFQWHIWDELHFSVAYREFTLMFGCNLLLSGFRKTKGEACVYETTGYELWTSPVWTRTRHMGYYLSLVVLDKNPWNIPTQISYRSWATDAYDRRYGTWIWKTGSSRVKGTHIRPLHLMHKICFGGSPISAPESLSQSQPHSP